MTIQEWFCKFLTYIRVPKVLKFFYCFLDQLCSVRNRQICLINRKVEQEAIDQGRSKGS
jgi:hypothetical protein